MSNIVKSILMAVAILAPMTAEAHQTKSIQHPHVIVADKKKVKKKVRKKKYHSCQVNTF